MAQVKEKFSRKLHMHPFWSEIFLLALLALVYGVAASVGQSLITEPGGIPIVWPASGVALAFLLQNPKRRWTYIAITIYFVGVISYLTSGHPLYLSLIFAFIDVIEALLGAFLLCWLLKNKISNFSFGRVADVFSLFVVPMTVSLFTALTGASISALAFGASFFEAWQLWWVSDGLGILLFAPLVIIWMVDQRLRWLSSSSKAIETFALVSLLSLFSWLMFGPFTLTKQPVIGSYMLFPFLIWLAFRFSPRSMANALLLIAGIAIWGTWQNDGIFALQNNNRTEALISLQIFLGFITFSGLLLSAIMTERKQNAETLKEAEASYRNIFENAPVGFFQSYPDGGYRNVNPRMAEIFGFSSPAEMLAGITDISEQIYVNVAVWQDFKRLLAEHGQVVDFVTRHRRKDGSPFWAATNARAILDKNGHPLYYEGFLQDIDERTRAEKAIEESHQFFQATMDSLSAHICVLEADGTILAVNKAWVNFADQNPPIIGNLGVGGNYLAVCDDVTGPEVEMARAFAAGIRAVMAGERETFYYEYPCHSPQEQRWFIGRVMHFADQESGRVVVAHENITERKLAEDALRESEASLKLSERVSHVGNWTWDAATNHVRFSDEMCRIFGLNPATFDGDLDKIITESVHPEDREKVYQSRNSTYNEQKPIPIEHRIILPDQSIRIVWAEAGESFYDANGKIIKLSGIVQDITERKLSENTLRESEASLKLSERVSHVGNWTWDTLTNRVTWSDEMYRIFGLDPATFDGDLDKVIAQAIHPADREKVIQSNNTVLTRQKSAPLEYRIVRPDKSERMVWAEAGAVISDANGKIIKLSGIVQDITERKLTEDALRASEAKWRSLFAILPVGISILDANRNITDFNPALGEMMDVTADGMINGTNIARKYIHPDGSPVLPEEFPSVRAIREQIIIDSVQIGVMKEDHHILWTEVSAAPLPLPDAACVVVTTDVTRRKLAESALRESEARLKGIVTSAMDGIVMVDSDQHIILFNDAAEKIFKLPASKAIGQPLDFILPQDKQNLHKNHIQRFGETSVTTRSMSAFMDITAQRSNGETFPIESSISQFMVDGQKFYTAILRDITERKQMEENLRASLLEKEALLKEVHHRVKNNLQIVSSLLSMQANSARNDLVTHALEESKNRVRAMALIHEKLYRSENLEYIQAEEYIPELINHLSGSLLEQKKSQIRFDLQIASITFDIGKAIPCGMIITELISNALKYAFPQERPGVIKIHLEMEAGRTRLMVSDDGVGLSPALDLDHPETLGLELVSILSRQLKAELQIIRQPGATFIITFRN